MIGEILEENPKFKGKMVRIRMIEMLMAQGSTSSQANNSLPDRKKIQNYIDKILRKNEFGEGNGADGTADG